MSSQQERPTDNVTVDPSDTDQIEAELPATEQPESSDPRGAWIAGAVTLFLLVVIVFIAWQVWPSADDPSQMSPEDAATYVAREFATATMIPLFTPQGPSILAVSVPPLDLDGELTVQGRVAPGAVVDLLVDGEPRGRAQVDADGIWSYYLTLDAPGVYELSASALLSGTRLSMNGELPSVIVPTVTPTPSATPSSTPTPSATPSPTPSATATQTPTYTSSPTALPTATSTATLTPTRALLGPSIFDRLIPASVVAGEVEFVGMAEPGASVNLLVDGALAAAAVADEEGIWSIRTNLVPGEHTISVQALVGEVLMKATDETVLLSVVDAESASTTSTATSAVILVPTTTGTPTPTETNVPETATPEPIETPNLMATFQAGAANFVATVMAATPTP